MTRRTISCEPPVDDARRVLYYSPVESDFHSFVDRLAEKRERVDGGSEIPRFRSNGIEVDLVREHALQPALDILHDHYIHLLVLDLRWAPDEPEEFENGIREGLRFLDALDDPEDLELRYGFHRVLCLVSGPAPGRVDDLIAELGRRGVGGVLRQRPYDPPRERACEFVAEVFEQMVSMIQHRRVGKTALAASGGGITGIYFEQGALKCLSDCLSSGVSNFDMYFGISAGAVVTGLLANGYSIEEFMAAVAGHPGGRIPELDLALVRLGHLNLPDMKRRLGAALESMKQSVKDLFFHQERPKLDVMFLDYTSLVGPPFRSDRFEEILRDLFEKDFATNDFRELEREFFVGASDQDSHRHVLFGARGRDHVPISKAIQASLSVNPAFSAVPIEGRYYEDGAITRTSDFIEAIERGADLIFVVDPFVPYVSDEPGLAHRRGLLYNIDQDIRALSYTRYENTRNWILRRHPEVSSYTFLPSNRARRLLSTNPMDHRPYLPIWRGAYLSTLRRVHALCHRMRGDLISHGITIDTERADAVADRLRHTPEPTFADFFPDGEVEL